MSNWIDYSNNNNRNQLFPANVIVSIHSSYWQQTSNYINWWSLNSKTEQVSCCYRHYLQLKTIHYRIAPTSFHWWLPCVSNGTLLWLLGEITFFQNIHQYSRQHLGIINVNRHYLYFPIGKYLSVYITNGVVFIWNICQNLSSLYKSFGLLTKYQ